MDSLSKHISHVDVLSFLSAMLRDGLTQIHSESAPQTGSEMHAAEGLPSEIIQEDSTSEVKETMLEGVARMECEYEESETKKKKKRRKKQSQERECGVERRGRVETQEVLDLLTQGMQLLCNIRYAC